jgi:hypothetical protein
MTERATYIGGSTGGVPEYVFGDEFVRGSVEGLSQTRLLYCDVTPRALIVREDSDINSDTRYVHAWIDTHNDLRLNVRTRDKDNKLHHPDVYAGQLVRRFVWHALQHGQRIAGVYDTWGRQSTNFLQFEGNLQILAPGRVPTQAEEHTAAKGTFTGEIANEIGCTDPQILNNWRQTTTVKVRFGRQLTL